MSDIRHVKHPFPAVIDAQCKLLILGSVPSVKSVQEGFYYMHPRNRFWQVMGALLHEDFIGKTAAERTSLLLKHHIALYDSVEECDIEASSDAHIRNALGADIPALIASSQISRIYLNGAASYKYFAKFHPQLLQMAQQLPSTSPANAAYSLQKLIESWRVILQN